MCANKEAMSGGRCVRKSGGVRKGQPQGLRVKLYVFLYGSHWVVSVGQSKAVLRIKSYR